MKESDRTPLVTAFRHLMVTTEMNEYQQEQMRKARKGK